MPDVVIQNPVINSPFEEPTRHFEFGDRGITEKVIDGQRRESSYLVPILRGRVRPAPPGRPASRSRSHPRGIGAMTTY
ncbi:MAG: hypothetical protein Q8S13_02745, partial [Dehalococcoidia bacterium]|nr:hypothetical protein [Dehalococcoidia bacterium]